MKNWILLLALASSVLMGCQKDSLEENTVLTRPEKWRTAETIQGNIGQEITLKLGQTVLIRPDGFYITFQDVVEDSRCPSTVDCIWEGRAVIHLALENRDEYLEVELETPNSQAENGTTVQQFGRAIQLVKVEPYPDGHLPIPLNCYRAILMVKKQGSTGGQW